MNDCDGLPVNVGVVLNDQFGGWNATVTFPRYFCNPIAKHVDVPTPRDYPIEDTNQHYVCYQFTMEAHLRTALITDQFVSDLGVQLQPSYLLCVPTLKTGVTATGKNTWGRLKTLYR